MPWLGIEPLTGKYKVQQPKCGDQVITRSEDLFWGTLHLQSLGKDTIYIKVKCL